jgi:hypothetical protein
MADIFGSREGFVAVVHSQSIIPGKVKLGNFEPKAALISSADFDQRTNQQFQTTLDGSVFIYVFGDQMGQVVVEGRSFPALCPNTTGGLKEIFDFYARRRASKTPEPVQVVVGDESIIGFLTALKVRSMSSSEDPAGLYQQFQMVINTLPKI